MSHRNNFFNSISVYPTITSLQVARFVSCMPHIKSHYNTAIQILDANMEDIDFPLISNNHLRLLVDDIISIDTEKLENGYYKSRKVSSLVLANSSNLIDPVIKLPIPDSQLLHQPLQTIQLQINIK